MYIALLMECARRTRTRIVGQCIRLELEDILNLTSKSITLKKYSNLNKYLLALEEILSTQR